MTAHRQRNKGIECKEAELAHDHGQNQAPAKRYSFYELSESSSTLKNLFLLLHRQLSHLPTRLTTASFQNTDVLRLVLFDHLNDVVSEPERSDPQLVVTNSRPLLQRLGITELTELRKVGLVAVEAPEKLERV